MDMELLINTMIKKSGLKTQKALSEWANLSQSYITKWKKQGYIPDDVVDKFNREFGELFTIPSEFDQIASQWTPELDLLIHSQIEKNITDDITSLPLVSSKARAGDGNNLEGIEDFNIVGTMAISKMLLKTKPNGTLRIIGVEGYSMVPMLYPDSFVIFDEHNEWKGDGLYILNWRNDLMIKLLQIDPYGKLHIKSVNKEYESWTVDPDDESVFKIIGKVLRIII